MNWLFIAFFFISSAIMFPIALIIWSLTVLFDKRLLALHYFTMFWSAMYIWVIPRWKVTTRGRNLVDHKQAYVIVSNHQSFVDIMAAAFLYIPFKWVSKAEVFKVPFIGWNMKLNKYIGLQRGGRKSIAKMMIQCNDTLEQGSSVFIFPEGTRSDTGEMRKFMPGAFIIAQRKKVPILPIVMSGTRKALPKKSLNLSGQCNIEVEVLDPIPYEDFATLKPEEIGAKVRGRIEERLSEIEAS